MVASSITTVASAAFSDVEETSHFSGEVRRVKKFYNDF